MFVSTYFFLFSFLLFLPFSPFFLCFWFAIEGAGRLLGEAYNVSAFCEEGDSAYVVLFNNIENVPFFFVFSSFFSVSSHSFRFCFWALWRLRSSSTRTSGAAGGGGGG